VLSSINAEHILNNDEFHTPVETDTGKHYEDAVCAKGANQPLAAGLRRQVKRTPVQLLDDPARAEVVLEATREVRDRNVVASTSVGQV
ncbi:hypothetical protein Q6271_28070, partial [Klebsiella pneumoniae]|nr:hypothetical protein [Klebsiella pneumoniae]